MYRCLIWEMGRQFRLAIHAFRFLEERGAIQVIGAVSEKIDVFDDFLGCRYYPVSGLASLEYDCLVICKESGEDYRSAAERAYREFGVPREKMIPYEAFLLPDFEVGKALALRKNPVTIFANNCWAVYTYSYLCLPFSSPFINLFLDQSEYMRFLRAPREYMNEPLRFGKVAYCKEKQGDYPVGMLGDVPIHFLHYDSFEEAEMKWEARKSRINWDNLLVEIATDDKELAAEFARLPYRKKIGFVPFACEEERLQDISFMGRGAEHGGWKRQPNPFMGSVFSMARGKYLYYDVHELLYSGEIKLLSKGSERLNGR